MLNKLYHTFFCIWLPLFCIMFVIFKSMLGNYIPLYKITIISLSILLLMGIWVVCSLGLQWIMLLWTLLCIFLLNVLISLHIYLEIELLDHRVCICSASVGTTKQFSKVFVTIYVSISSIRWFQLLHILTSSSY